ncbi:MAG: ISAs1 family transposase [Hyphomicrobiales bacterium]|nr:ISAs1 family transposase [Hyphomicrobiales bacterium]
MPQMSDSRTKPVFLQYFEPVEDPRQAAKILYPFEEILLLVLCAVISGADNWTSIALYGQKKLDVLRRFLPFADGTPCHDQLGILFSRLDMEQFQQCFVNWVAALHETLDKGAGVIAIDGKTLRRSFDTATNKAAIHVISAWACEQKLVLGQRKVDDKSNEITAIPELLALLSIEGAIITIDAMGCQRKICQQIIAQKADYVIGLKGNQGSLRDDVELFFDEHDARDIADGFIKQNHTVDGDHGRIEERRYVLCSDIDWLNQRHQWPGLESIIMVKYRREIKGQTKTVRRYYISSLNEEPEKMASIIRNHWQIENNLHWVMDMTYRQDECRIRTGNAAANFATIKHAANNLLQKAPGKKSLPMKRHSAAWDDDYLVKIIKQ